MIITCHPAACSNFWLRASLSWLRIILSRQKSALVAGRCFWHSCPCQKQPLTNITVRHLRITMSGRPGNDFTYSRYRNPCRHNHRRTTISGLVSRPLMRLIQRCRCSGVILSAIAMQNYSFPPLSQNPMTFSLEYMLIGEKSCIFTLRKNEGTHEIQRSFRQ